MVKILSEPEVQDLVYQNTIVQDGVKNALGIPNDMELLREDTYINGITADFTVVVDNKITAIIECKSGNINVTDYVRGIGQLLQYEYFWEEKIPHKSLEYEEKIKTIYLFPSSVIKNNIFNIAKFKYPKTTIIYELNEFNYAIREISNNELKKFNTDIDDHIISISPYYFRDNRIFEYYILINYLLIQERLGFSKVDRKVAEDTFLKKIETINNGNWRNAFITLSNLGLINNKNLPTQAGKMISINTYEKFAVEMFHSYLEPYFKEILDCFNGKDILNANNQDFLKLIKNRHKNQDILYLTQSNGRYISSWLNIMRDDYGIIDFKTRSNSRILNYNPFDLNDEALEQKINEYSIANGYLKRYMQILRREVYNVYDL